MEERKLNKRQFIDYLVKSRGLTHTEASEAYDTVIGGIIEVVGDGISLSLMGFGVFYLQEHRGHPIQFKGEKTYVDGYRVVKFSASNALNLAVREGAYEGKTAPYLQDGKESTP